MPLFNYNEIVEKVANEAPTYRNLDEGDYDFVISEVPTVDNERLRVQTRPRVVEGERKNAMVFFDLDFDSSKEAWILRNTVSALEAMGLTPDQINSAQTLEQIAQMIFGKSFAATVKHTPNKNDPSKVYVNLRGIRPSTVSVAGPSGPTAGGFGGGFPGPAPTQNAPQSAPQPVQQNTPPAQPQTAPADPWSTPPAQEAQPQSQPTTSFTPPPMPFQG